MRMTDALELFRRYYHATPGEVLLARLDPTDLLSLQFSRKKAEYLIATGADGSAAPSCSSLSSFSFLRENRE